MTNSPARSEAVRKYFARTPVKPGDPDYSNNQTKIRLGWVLLFLTLILFSSGNGFNIFSGVISGYFGFKVLADGFSAYSKQKKEHEEACKKYEEDYEATEPKPSDEQIDKWTKSDIEKIVGKALRRLDLEHEDYKANPLLICGPAPEKETMYARGRDGKTRYSHLNITVIFLTDYHVAAYQATYIIESGKISTDNTQEFPYKEITNLGTQTVKHEIRLVDDVIVSESGLQEFTLSTSGANVIRVLYAFARSTDSQGELLKIGGGESTITAIRKKLQDYKQKYEK